MVAELVHFIGETSVEHEKAIVEALWSLKKTSMKQGEWGDEYVRVKTVAIEANKILKKKGIHRITSRKCGYLLRRLGLQVGPRRGAGYPVWWNEEKMVRLAKLFGINEPQMKRMNTDKKEVCDGR